MVLKIYQSSPNQVITEVDSFTKGSWVSLIDPREDEVRKVITSLNIFPNFFADLQDPEEKARIEVEDDQVLIVIEIPIIERDNGKLLYDTIPLGIIITDHHIVTVCLKDNPVVREFEKTRIKEFYTFKKTRFVLQILLRSATFYLKYLREISRRSDTLETRLRQSMENKELFNLLDLEKSLVYFTTSLKSNEMVMNKLFNSNILKMYEEDKDVLEDAMVETSQAIDMANIYTNILTSMMDAFASVISNNMNLVMRFLASITIVLSFPTMVASFFGMNVPLPFANFPHRFLLVFIISLVLSVVSLTILYKKRML